MFDYASIPDNVELSQYFKYDPNHFKSLLTVTKDDRIIVTKPLDIMFPETYEEKNFAKVSGSLELLGIFAIIDPATKKYTCFSIPARVRANLSHRETITHNEEKYVVISYDAFDTLLETKYVIADDKLTYWLYDFFVALARVPWYLSYNQLLRIYDQDQYYIKRRVSQSSQLAEMIISNIARNPSNELQMFRYALKAKADENKLSPRWVPLKNISLGMVDSYSKIMGSYYDEGVTSALANDSTVQTNIEKALRM